MLVNWDYHFLPSNRLLQPWYHLKILIFQSRKIVVLIELLLKLIMIQSVSSGNMGEGIGTQTVNELLSPKAQHDGSQQENTRAFPSGEDISGRFVSTQLSVKWCWDPRVSSPAPRGAVQRAHPQHVPNQEQTRKVGKPKVLCLAPRGDEAPPLLSLQIRCDASGEAWSYSLIKPSPEAQHPQTPKPTATAVVPRSTEA